MTPRSLLLFCRAALATALFASAALVIDYRNAGDPAFCGAATSCFKVRVSPVSRSIAQAIYDATGAPITLPQLAIFLFFGVFVLTFFLRSRAALKLLTAATGVGAVAALGFIVAQASIGAFCLYCMIVDVAALAAAVGCFVLYRAVPDEVSLDKLTASLGWSTDLRWGVVATISVALPFIWERYPVVPPLPAPIAAMQVEGKLTVISLTDFECPFCRKMHGTLSELEKRPDVAFRRIMVPLDGHPGAMPAALAYLCTPEAKRHDLAELLYAAKPELLTDASILEMARAIGVDAAALETCVVSNETLDELAKQKALFDEVGGRGLPTTFVGGQTILGLNPEKVVEAATPGRDSFGLPIPLMFVVFGFVVAAVSFTTMRTRAERPT